MSQVNKYIRVLPSKDTCWHKHYSQYYGMVGKIIDEYFSIGEDDCGRKCYRVEVNLGIDRESKTIFCYTNEVEFLTE